MKKVQRILNFQEKVWQKDHRNVKFFAPVKVIMAKHKGASPEGQLYRGHVVNIQKIQNGDSEFFVNSRCYFKC